AHRHRRVSLADLDVCRRVAVRRQRRRLRAQLRRLRIARALLGRGPGAARAHRLALFISHRARLRRRRRRLPILRRRRRAVTRLLLTALAVAAAGCDPTVRFADRAILWHWPDDRPVPKPKTRRLGIFSESTRDAVFAPA